MYQKMKLGVLKSIPVTSRQRSVITPSARFVMGGSGMPYGEMLRAMKKVLSVLRDIIMQEI